jgi:hypothetical protein
MTSHHHSIQHQNSETRERIVWIAREFRRDPSQFPGVIHTLHSRSLDPGQGILVECKDFFDQTGHCYQGCWLTHDREFFRFSVLIPFDRADPPVVEEWREVTNQTEISPNLPGAGKSFGWLALDVLRNEFPSSENGPTRLT